MADTLVEINREIDALHARGELRKVPPLLAKAAKLIREMYGENSAQYASALNELGGAASGAGGL